MIWERDYMRRPVDSAEEAEPAPKPFDIFAGVPLEDLPKSPVIPTASPNVTVAEPVKESFRQRLARAWRAVFGK